MIRSTLRLLFGRNRQLDITGRPVFIVTESLRRHGSIQRNGTPADAEDFASGGTIACTLLRMGVDFMGDSVTDVEGCLRFFWVFAD